MASNSGCTLAPGQRRACRRINAHAQGDHQTGARHRFRVFMSPTVGPPSHLALRLYDISGRLIRTWVIDG